MKFHVQGKPVYHFSLTSATIKVLMKLADMHYDGRCKSIARPGGFLYGWKNMVELDELDCQRQMPYTCKADFSELDTLSKVCEMYNYLEGVERDIAYDVWWNIREIFIQSSETVQKWGADFDFGIFSSFSSKNKAPS